MKILYEDERRFLRKNTNKDSLNSESSSDSEEREGASQHGKKERCFLFCLKRKEGEEREEQQQKE